MILVTLVIVGLLASFSAACLGFVLWSKGRREESAREAVETDDPPPGTRCTYE